MNIPVPLFYNARKAMRQRKTSQTRLERRNGQLSIFYKRRSDENEQEMIKISVGVDSNEDSLCSSNSSPVLLSQTDNSSAKSKSSSKKKRKKARGSHTVRRMTSRPIQVRWRTREKRVGHSSYCDIDEETKAILESLRVLNNKIRRKFEIGVVTTPSSQTSETYSNSTSFSSSSSNSSSTAPSECSVLTAKVYDYRGVPLSNPLAVTPFPRASSLKTREKATELLKNMGGQKKEVVKTPKESSSGRKLTRVSSDTRFPGARSPATREKVRALIKEFAISQRSEPQRQQSDHSLKTIYSKSIIGCKSCNSCTACIGHCVQNHTMKLSKKTKNK